MKNVVFVLVFIICSCFVFSQHNTIVPKTSTLTTFVAVPVIVQPTCGASCFYLVQQVLELPANGMLDGSNQWQFNIVGEPGNTVHVEFFEPITESAGAPLLTGGWHDDSGPILTQTKDYVLSISQPSFNTWYQLDKINATNATIGNKTYIIKLIYNYLI
jgi:hypothetical protein